MVPDSAPPPAVPMSVPPAAAHGPGYAGSVPAAFAGAGDAGRVTPPGAVSGPEALRRDGSVPGPAEMPPAAPGQDERGGYRPAAMPSGRPGTLGDLPPGTGAYPEVGQGSPARSGAGQVGPRPQPASLSAAPATAGEAQVQDGSRAGVPPQAGPPDAEARQDRTTQAAAHHAAATHAAPPQAGPLQTPPEAGPAESHGGGRHGQAAVPMPRPPAEQSAHSAADRVGTAGAPTDLGGTNPAADRPAPEQADALPPDAGRSGRETTTGTTTGREATAGTTTGREATTGTTTGREPAAGGVPIGREATTGEVTAGRRSHAAPDDEPRAGAGPAPVGEPRIGAHAAPYMDPDGTLHNLRPIGRLAVSGPDPEPRRLADTNFHGMWFAAPVEKDATTEQPTAAPDAPDEQATQRPAAAAGDEGSAANRQAAPEQAGGSAEGMVIDLDVTGLFTGLAIGPQPTPADAAARPHLESPAPGHHPESSQDTTAQDDPAALRVEDGRLAVPSDAGSRQHAEPQPDASAQDDPAALRIEVDRRIAVPPPAPSPEPDPAATTPERPMLSAADLEAIRWRLDGGTLREVVDDRDALRELGERLDGPLADEVDNVAKAGLLSVRAEVYRLLGELGMAAAASRLALAHAESAQDVQSMVIAQAELAHILRLRGDFKEADRLFAKAAGARVPETLRSVVHENAGRSCFDQGRHMEALDHFAQAVRLGTPDDSELAARIGVCLEAVYIHVLRDGWGPYPRSGPEILGETAPAPGPDALDETTAERPAVHRR